MIRISHANVSAASTRKQKLISGRQQTVEKPTSQSLPPTIHINQKTKSNKLFPPLSEHQATIMQLKRECKEELERMHVSGKRGTSWIFFFKKNEASLITSYCQEYVETPPDWSGLADVSPEHKMVLNDHGVFRCSL